jgi:hypothetical protein
MANAGQTTVVLICSGQPPGAAAGQVGGPADLSICPSGQQAYAVQAYLPYAGAQQYFDALATPFDPTAASGIFGFGFGLVVFFYVLGLKGSILLKPFWR